MSNTFSPLVDVKVISPFCTKPRQSKITHFVIHHMAGNLSAKLCGQWFQNPSARCSSNYGVGSDGQIGGYVPEENRAWTTGSGAIDHKAITIEVADDGTKPWHTSDKAIQSTIKLIADCCKRNGIKRLSYTGDKQGNLHKHCWYQNTDCPGSYLGGKFPYIAQEVNKLLSPQKYTGAYPTKLPERGYFKIGDGYDRLTSYKSQIKKVQKYLNWALDESLAVDGNYGPKTKSACLIMQKKLGMKNTHGNWGMNTQVRAKEYEH